MKVIYKAIVGLILLFVFLGCESSPVDLVKNGTLNLDPSTTVGNAFRGYQGFMERKWRFFKDRQGRKIVEFSAKLKLDADALELSPYQLTGENIPLAPFSAKAIKKRYFNLKGGNYNIKYIARFRITIGGKSPGPPMFYPSYGKNLQLSRSGLEIVEANNKIFAEYDDSLFFNIVLRDIYNDKPVRDILSSTSGGWRILMER